MGEDRNEATGAEAQSDEERYFYLDGNRWRPLPRKPQPAVSVVTVVAVVAAALVIVLTLTLFIAGQISG